jgi:hypothetical protein
MTLADAAACVAGGLGGDEARETLDRARRALGEGVAAAVATGDRAALERAARLAGTHRVLMATATAAGVDPDALEEMLASI